MNVKYFRSPSDALRLRSRLQRNENDEKLTGSGHFVLKAPSTSVNCTVAQGHLNFLRCIYGHSVTSASYHFRPMAARGPPSMNALNEEEWNLLLFGRSIR
jgi:hypothetical protein